MAGKRKKLTTEEKLLREAVKTNKLLAEAVNILNNMWRERSPTEG